MQQARPANLFRSCASLARIISHQGGEKVGIFGGVDQADFDKFRSTIGEQIAVLNSNVLAITNGKIPQIESRIAQTASESAQDAAQALEEIRLKRAALDQMAQEMHAAHTQIEAARSTLLQEMELVSTSKEKFLQESESLALKSSESLALHDSVVAASSNTQNSIDSITSQLNEVQRLLEQAANANEAIENLKKTLSDANSQNENIKSLLTHSMKKTAEFDELHKEIFGHNIEDSAGNTQRVDGLKDQLTKSYEELDSKIGSLDELVDTSIQAVEGRHDSLREAQRTEFASLLEGGKASLSEVSDQLKALLPGALAAGLSAAYESKKDEEASFLASHERSFKFAVYGLVAVSIIPFGVNCYLLMQGTELASVLKDTPRLVVSILPLYFPVLWLAYSANKRLNLSKRLIEEYTHKAVLGKTFSGLSNQIEGLANDASVKDELRTRLLFNVLQVSAENPGKLITDYSKADHPLMDVLEKSARLSESVDALSKVPGLGAVARALSSRRDNLVREQESKIEAGFSINEELDTKPDEQQGQP